MVTTQAGPEEAAKTTGDAEQPIDGNRVLTEARRVLAMVEKADEFVGATLPYKFNDPGPNHQVIFQAHVVFCLFMGKAKSAVMNVAENAGPKVVAREFLKERLQHAWLLFNGADAQLEEMVSALRATAWAQDTLSPRWALAQVLLEQTLREVAVLRDEPPMEGDA